MSYVPPHLRSSITTTTSTKTLDSNGDHKLNSHHFSHSNNNNYNSSSALSNAARRSSDNLLSPPDPIVPLWNPSDRVLHLKPEQVAFCLSSISQMSFIDEAASLEHWSNSYSIYSALTTSVRVFLIFSYSHFMSCSSLLLFIFYFSIWPHFYFHRRSTEQWNEKLRSQWLTDWSREAVF